LAPAITAQRSEQGTISRGIHELAPRDRELKQLADREVGHRVAHAKFSIAWDTTRVDKAKLATVQALARELSAELGKRLGRLPKLRRKLLDARPTSALLEPITPGT
jgi:hypothetical protein